MSTACRISEQNELHYVTFQIVQWIDIHLLLRSPLANSSTFINRTLIKNAHFAMKRQVNWIFASRRPAISPTKAEPLPNLSRLFLICYAEQGVG